MTSREFRMPDVGEGIAEAEIVSWLVEVGDIVEEHQPVCAVETDKSLVEIPAPITGTITARHGAEGDTVSVGTVLVVIESAAGPGQAPAPAETTAPTASPTTPAAEPVPPPARTTGPRPLASPRIRRLAAQRGIDLTLVTGTGPHGRILEADVDAAGEGARTDVSTGTAADRATDSDRAVTSGQPHGIRHRAGGQTREDEVVRLRGLRRSIARSMTQALTIPHVTEFREVDATNLLAAHRRLRTALEGRGVRLSLFPLLLQAVIRALEMQPTMNATFDAAAETVTRHGHVNLGMATATDDGLIVPVIREADRLDLVGLAAEVERLAEAARHRTAAPDELVEGTFTVTNFGSFGTWLGNPVIRPPEVGIAGFGRITEQVVAVDGLAVVRPVLPMVVATDHRIHDGSHLADFVSAVQEALVDPVLLLV